jgi:KUP system potassium uptake protein
MLLWFFTSGLLGPSMIVSEPRVLAAVNPSYGAHFLTHNGLVGYLVLGTIFLVVTGGETLYADMGHYGPQPIRLAWFCVVLPSLVLNYFGQGALLLDQPEAEQPFFQIVPSWVLYPLVLLATLATIIASQALITAVFSLTRQAIQLGQFPRMKIIQTSREEFGQIYIPAMNWLLMAATVGLVLGIRSSSNLTSAYGIAVSINMVMTSTLAAVVARRRGWRPLVLGTFTGALLTVDVAFLGANMFKIPEGGWYALLAGAFMFLIMYPWRRGRE